MDPISKSSIPGSEVTVRPRLFNPYRDNRFAESNETIVIGVGPRREQPRVDTGEQLPTLCPSFLLISPGTISTVVSHNKSMDAEGQSVGDPVASSSLLVSDEAATAITTARERDSQNQLRRPPSMLSLYSPGSRSLKLDVAPHIDDNAKNKPRASRFHIRRRLGRIFDPTHDTESPHK